MDRLVGEAVIRIFGPDDDGRFTIEFRKPDGQALTIYIPDGRDAGDILRYFHGRLPYGLVVRDSTG
jgi:hypothetical protein